MTRTLASYLAENSQESLQHMKANLRQARVRAEEEVQNLAFEERVIDQALTRKSRRSTASSGSSSSRMSRERVLELVNRTFTDGFNSTHVVNAFAAEGVDTNGEAVRQHLRRLADEGKILRRGKAFAPMAPTGVLREHPDQASLNGASREGENREIRLGVGPQDGPG